MRQSKTVLGWQRYRTETPVADGLVKKGVRHTVFYNVYGLAEHYNKSEDFGGGVALAYPTERELTAGQSKGYF